MLSIPYARLDQLLHLTMKWEIEETRTRYREHAIVSWRLESTLRGMFAQGEVQNPSLAEYWDDIGIGDGSTIEARQGELVDTAEDAIEKAYAAFGITPGSTGPEE